MNMATAYSKREQDLQHQMITDKFMEFRSDLSDRMDTFEDNTKEQLTRMEKKQDYTNGKVAFLYKWYWIAVGFCGCVSILMLPLIWALIQANKI